MQSVAVNLISLGIAAVLRSFVNWIEFFNGIIIEDEECYQKREILVY